MPPILATDRLVLRPFVEDDAPLLLALDSDPEVMRYVGPFRLPDEAAYRARIRDYFLPSYDRHPGYGFWPAEERATGTFVGWFHLRPALDYRFAAEAGFRAGEYDIGFRLTRPAWGKGYATEVARALVARAFTDPGVRAVVATVLVGNVASCGVLEKAGLRKTGEFALPGFEMPAAKYELAMDEFVLADSA
jgi:RimJ/RimL family protein N-acetyltransferase